MAAQAEMSNNYRHQREAAERDITDADAAAGRAASNLTRRSRLNRQLGRPYSAERIGKAFDDCNSMLRRSGAELRTATTIAKEFQVSVEPETER